MRHNASQPDASRPATRGAWRRLKSLAGLLVVAGLATTMWAATIGTPAAAAMRGAPKAYVGLFNDNAVAVIDTGTNRVLTTIPIPAGPHGLVISPDGLRVYASSDGDSTVSISIDVGKAPHGMAINRSGSLVLVAVFGASQVAMIDTVQNEVVARIPVGNPHNIAISPDGGTAYVASQQPGAAQLAILDLAARRQVGTVPLDKTPRALTFSPDGAALYCTLAGSDSVQVLDPKQNRIVAQIPVGASPHHPFFTANGEYGLVVSQGPGELAFINPGTHTVIGTVAVGKQPNWIAASSDGHMAYVTNEGSNSVSVVDVEKQRVLATIPVGNAPRKIVVQPVHAAKDAAVAPADVRAQAPPLTASAPGAAVSTAPAMSDGSGAVRIQNFAFTPAPITVTPGTTVVWTNADAIPHTTTGKDKQWDSGPIQPGTSFKVTFDKAGTYTYACAIHPFMQGTVVVGN